MQKPLNTSLGCDLGLGPGQLGFSGFQVASFLIVGTDLCLYFGGTGGFLTAAASRPSSAVLSYTF